MISIFSIIGELLYTTAQAGCLLLVGLTAIGLILWIPILGVAGLFKLICLIFHLEFSWLVPIAFVGLAACFIVTAGEE